MNQFQYPETLATIDEFYHCIYAIPARANRDNTTPKLVTQRLLKQLGHPEKSVETVLITGSKGKGSTAIMLSALLRSAGKTVGRFSSPHLFDFRERIMFNENLIEPSALLSIANKVFTAINELSSQLRIENQDEYPRFFEIVTAIAYLYFAEKKVDYAIIETGIGALTDATNQDSHCLSILTNIEAEHLDLFGHLDNLAIEKAGVIRDEIPLIIGTPAQTINPIIINSAKKAKAPVIDFKPQSVNWDSKSQSYCLTVDNCHWTTDSSLKAKNAWVALSAFSLLNITLGDVEKSLALTQAKLPAREELVCKNPLIVIDGAHTAESANNLSRYVNHIAPKKSHKRFLLLSFSAEKNIYPVLSAFTGIDTLIITKATNARSLTPEVIKEYLTDNKNGLNTPNAIILIPSPEQALKQTLELMSKEDVLVITGSIYLAGLLRQSFNAAQ